MTDLFSTRVRSRIMSVIKSKNTKPELIVEKNLKEAKIRFTKHDKNILGMPDFAMKSYKLVVFVDGCFWHGCALHFIMPKSNVNFWMKKIKRNIERRKTVVDTLRKNGWKVVEIWEHELAL